MTIHEIMEWLANDTHTMMIRHDKGNITEHENVQWFGSDDFLHAYNSAGLKVSLPVTEFTRSRLGEYLTCQIGNYKFRIFKD